MASELYATFTSKKVLIAVGTIVFLVVAGKCGLGYMFTSGEANSAKERVRRIFDGMKAGGNREQAIALWKLSTLHVPGGIEAFSMAADEFDASTGVYPFTIVGTSPSKTHSAGVSLTVYVTVPEAPVLLTPANGATGQPQRPTFSWNPAAGAATYTIEIATDPGFTIVHSASGLTAATYALTSDLIMNTRYYWRVRGTNTCGTGGNSTTFRFTTVAPPGECPIGTAGSQIYFTNFEAGDSGWTSAGTGNTWALSTARTWSATTAYKAVDSATVSDQQLVSPAIALPLGQSPLTLLFYQWQAMEVQPMPADADRFHHGQPGPWAQRTRVADSRRQTSSR